MRARVGGTSVIPLLSSFVFFCGVASLLSGGGAGFLIGGFAQKKFELQSKNSANLI